MRMRGFREALLRAVAQIEHFVGLYGAAVRAIEGRAVLWNGWLGRGREHIATGAALGNVMDEGMGEFPLAICALDDPSRHGERIVAPGEELVYQRLRVGMRRRFYRLFA